MASEDNSNSEKQLDLYASIRVEESFEINLPTQEDESLKFEHINN